MRSNPNPGGNARFGEIFRSLETHRMIREMNCADSGSGMPKTSLGGTKAILWRLWCGQLHSKGFWSDFSSSVASFVLLAKCVPTQ